MRDQIRGINDAGYNGWILWHPGSKYDIFVSAFERETPPS